MISLLRNLSIVFVWVSLSVIIGVGGHYAGRGVDKICDRVAIELERMNDLETFAKDQTRFNLSIVEEFDKVQYTEDPQADPNEA